MTGVRVNARVVLLIPDSWDSWVHDGVLYRRSSSGTIYRSKRRISGESPQIDIAPPCACVDSQSLSLHV